MKIAIVFDMIYPFNIGGSELRNYEIAKRLTKKGHEVHLFGVKLWKGKNTIKKDGLILHGVCRYKELYNFKGQRTIFEPIKFAIRLYNPLKKEKFDIIDASAFVYFHCFTCKAVSLLKKTPLIFTWQQYWDNYWYKYLGFFKGFIGKNIEKIARHLTKNHITVSKTTKKDLIKGGAKEKNIFLNYCGVDIKEINSIKKQKKIYDIIFVGRLAHQKNVKLLIEAIYLLKKKLPKIKACIIGNGPDREKLEILTKKLRLNENIIFIDFLKDKKEVYKKMKQSEIFVLPSLLEGLGIVVIEAMACGLPVIVINEKWNASKELIVQRKNGFVVENNPKKMADLIKKLLKNTKLRKKIAECAVKKSKDFDWDKITDELEKYYLNIIEKSKKNAN